METPINNESLWELPVRLKGSFLGRWAFFWAYRSRVLFSLFRGLTFFPFPLVPVSEWYRVCPVDNWGVGNRILHCWDHLQLNRWEEKTFHLWVLYGITMISRSQWVRSQLDMEFSLPTQCHCLSALWAGCREIFLELSASEANPGSYMIFFSGILL